ncbi:MAG: sigma factor-like helix-turn-helix DNA-binding protein [Streptosporangiaceae bacterium]
MFSLVAGPPPRQRHVFASHYEGWSTAEIAAQLSIEQAAVRQNLARRPRSRSARRPRGRGATSARVRRRLVDGRGTDRYDPSQRPQSQLPRLVESPAGATAHKEQSEISQTAPEPLARGARTWPLPAGAGRRRAS